MARDLACSVIDCEYVVKLGDNEPLSDGLALLNLHDRQAHAATPHRSAHDAVRIERPKRPTLQLKQMGCTEEEWTFFKHRWAHFKTLANITEGAAHHLMECLDTELQQQLYATIGPGISNLNEAQLTSHIEQLAVRARNKIVATKTLRAKKQGPDQPVQSFVADIRAIARECDFRVKVPQCTECACQHERTVNYTDDMVRDQLIFGLADSDIQQEILARREISLEDAITIVAGKESGKWSQKDMSQECDSISAISTYKQARRTAVSGEMKRCGYCGGHTDRNGRDDRERLCPAWGKNCTNCERPNHTAKVCRKPKQTVRTDQRANAMDLTIFSIEPDQHNGTKADVVEHVRFNPSREIWLPQSSSPMPTVSVDITVCHDAYKQLNIPGEGVARARSTKGVVANADTGATVCVAGTSLLKNLGLDTKCLTPVNCRLWSANKTQLRVLGGVFLDISSVGTRSVKAVHTKQLTYIAETVTSLFLSRDALAAMQVIPSNFPEVGAAHAGNEKIASVAAHERAPCGCPVRTKTPEPPTLPMPATEENRAALEKFIKDYYSSSVLNTCEHQPLPNLHGPPLSFMTDPKAVPVAVHSPIPVPAHWAKRVKADIDRDCRLGVLEPVPPNTPVTWCHRMVVAPKHNGDPRRTVDMTQLNKVSVRQTHHTIPPFKQAISVPRNTKKTTLDAWNGYHSVLIDERDRHLTTFITPWGRYRYRSAPQGYLASGDAYTHRYDKITADVKNQSRCVDDTIIWSSSIENSFERTTEYMTLVGANGIVLNPDKFHFAEDSVEFAGFLITPESVKPLPCHVDAIRNFPSPQNIKDIRAYFALVSQVSYAYSITAPLQPFRELLKKDRKFYWDDNLQKLFEQSRHHIADEVVHGIKSFELGRHTCLATDWSKTGLGFFLMQKYCTCVDIKPDCCLSGWKVCLVGSRFTSPAESRYSPVEGECLAVADGLKKTRHFTLGCNRLTVATDHKPLLGVLGDKKLEDIENPRLLKLKEKTLAWNFTMVHVRGKVHVGPDAMSRYAPGRDVKFVISPESVTTDPARTDLLYQMTLSQDEESYPRL
jgi:hypothetical protein